MTKWDAIVIGAGHNGLVCAHYLAKSGLKVLMLEAGSEVGGAAITQEFCKGFKVSTAAHLGHGLHPTVCRDLGLSFDLKDVSTLGLMHGESIKLTDSKIIAGDVSAEDKKAYQSFKKRMKKHAKIIHQLALKPPPRLGGGDFRDKMILAKLGLSLRFGHGKEAMQDFLRIAGINIYDLVNEVFENEQLKGIVAFDAVLGHGMGPRTPNTVMTYLFRVMNELGGTLGMPRGGMGSMTDTLRDSVVAEGVEVRCDTKVRRIVSDGLSTTGVELETGERLEAPTVISNADPKTTFLRLLGASNMEAYFTHRVNNIRSKGVTAKLHLALSGLPEINGVQQADYGQRVVIAPSPDYIERAYNHVKYGEYSEKPAIEFIIPSISDPSLAPDGKHVLSALIQYAPLKHKKGWAQEKQNFLEGVMATLVEYMPDLSEKIRHTELLTPEDIEQRFNMTGGHWHHGEMALDQLFMMRPLYGAAQYQTPIEGLYLCGAGCHPGGGVTGLPGHNAAQVILKNVG